MKVFVIGYSDTGKTTTAKRIAQALVVPVVSASEWVVQSLGGEEFLPCHKNMRTRVLTEQTAALLRNDPERAVRHMLTHGDMSGSCVVEGVRNPYDFIRLYDPRYDQVVFLRRRGKDAAQVFENGVRVIEEYVQYVRDADLASHENRHSVFVVEHDAFGAEYESSISTVINRARTRMRHAPMQVTGVRIHVDMPPLPVLVRTEYFYDMDASREGTLTPAVAIALAGYPSESPTFTVRTDEGALFSYVPPSALLVRGSLMPAKPLLLRELVYHNCPEGPIAVAVHGALLGPVQVYLKARKEWLAGEYVLTVDWYEGNDLLHLVALENGQYAFQPSHKVLFGTSRTLPDYKKMNSTWKV